MRGLILVLGVCALAVSGCGDEEAVETPAPSCACEDGQCLEGVCTLQIVVNDACWGEAKIFIEDLSEAAEPVGVASVGAPFQLCEGFRAPTLGPMGEAVPGESFQFIVESGDGRSLAGSVSGQQFSCAGSAPFVFNLDGCE